MWPDEGLSTGFNPDPIKGFLYGRFPCEGGEELVFTGKCQKGDANDDSQNTLTGEKKHDKAG